MKRGREHTSKWSLLLIPALVVIAYSASTAAPFVYDDQIHIVDNRDVISFQSITDVRSMRRLLDHPFGLAARPLLFLSYGLNYAAFGLSAAAYRLTNYTIHTTNSLLVFTIVLELGRAALWKKEQSFRAALLAGSLFAVHPLLIESVTYIAGRSSSLCATFYFAGLYSVLVAGRSRSPKRGLLLMSVAACTVAGWLVKQDAITLPAAAIAVVWLTWPTSETSRSRWIATAVLAGPVMFLLVFQMQSLKAVSVVTQGNNVLAAAGFDETPPFWTYFWTSVREWTSYYLWRLFIPIRLNIDPQAVLTNGISSSALGSLAVMLGLAAAMLFLRRRDLMTSAGIALILMSPLAAYCLFPLADVVAEHRAYITALGAVILLTSVILRLPRSLLVSFALISIFVWLTRARNTVWNDPVLLWQDAERQAPEKLRPHFNLAGLYRSRGQLDRAVVEYDWILARRPGHPGALTNLASMDLDRKDFAKAESLLAPVVDGHIPFAPAYLVLSIIRIRQGRFEEGRSFLQYALQVDPMQPMLHHNLGDIFVNEGKLENAITEYVAELQLNPNSMTTHLNLAKTYEMAKLPEKSIEHYRIVQRTDPANPDVRDALARLR
jgi:protein O-mannosyl-transferase